MPVHVQVSEKVDYVLVITFVAPWTVEEWVKALKISRETQQAGEIEYVIFDTLRARSMPNNFLSSLQTIRNNFQNKVKGRVAVGSSMLVLSILSVLKNVIPNLMKNFEVVHNMDEAYALIAEWKTTRETR